MAQIHLQHLAHSYSKNPQNPSDYALKEIDHVWEDGKAYALLGPSGCGKTTLLNIISGLISPSQGQILFDGVDVTALPTEQRHIAQVFQFPVVYDTMTVYDNLAFPLRNRKQSKAHIRERVQEIARLLEMEDVLNKKARGLTADAKQKISLGRGLVREDVAAILFDEPLTVIDPHLKWMLRMQLKLLQQQSRRTMIYVTHDQTEALTFADEVVVMYDGQVVQIGTPQQLFEQPAHTFVGYFIGSPGMNILPAKLDGNNLYVANERLTLMQHYHPKQGATLELGIRPEFLSLSRDKTFNSLPVRVLRIEDIGRHKIVRVDFSGQALNVIVPEGKEVSAEYGYLNLELDKISLYANSWRIEEAK